MPHPQSRHVVCRAEDLPRGARKIVEVNGRSIGVFNVGGRYHAIRNVCPHQMAPLCLGEVTGTNLPSRPGAYRWGREGQIIRCPWHGWEFDLTTGKSVFNPHRCRVRSCQVAVEPAEGAEAPGRSPSEARTVDADAEEPSVETYPVTVEDRWVVLYV